MDAAERGHAHLPRCLGIFLLLVMLIASVTHQPASAQRAEERAASRPVARADTGESAWTLLNVDGQIARILRDEYGVPHVFAPTNRTLFYAAGYAVAQDRLWQLDLFRRTARGTLAEVLGVSALSSDLYERLHGYSESEYQQLFDLLPAEAQEIFTAYRDGVNAYMHVALADAEHKLPWEFHRLNYRPAPWQVCDTLAVGCFMARRFGEAGGQELANQALLQTLISAHGTPTGTAMFDDLRWLNDPDAPVSIPITGSGSIAGDIPGRILPGVEAVAAEVAAQQEQAVEVWKRYGIPTKLGSYAWAVSPERSATGHALLLGGPQMGFNAPELLHEVQLSGGQGFDVTGISFAGVPLVFIGHNRDLAWSITTGMGDNTDLYFETLNPADREQYWYNGAWQTMITRTETITVQGQASPTTRVMRRTLHGPVVAMDEANNLAYSMKRTSWMGEHRMLIGFLSLIRARNLEEFRQGIAYHEVSNNFMVADRAGNIAYWQAGAVPIRPDGRHVGRFPWRGDGSEEWTGTPRAVPYVANPPQGFLANWNNKPSLDFDNSDRLLGKQDRVTDIQERLAAHSKVSWDDMRALPKEIGAFLDLGNETRYVRRYLLEAIAAETPSDPQLQEVAARLAAWDGCLASDVVSSTRLVPEEEIWYAWLSIMRLDTFGDELGSSWSETNLNTLLHALDGANSGVRPSRDYFDDVNTEAKETANQIIVRALREALQTLTARYGTSDINAWSPARPVIYQVHPLGLTLGQMLASNRATYAQIVELSTPIVARNILPLGQSAFISPEGEPGEHVTDQLELFRRFEFKPMRLIALSTAQLPMVSKGQ